VADEAGSALDELREIARGLHPGALGDGGLKPALTTLTRRSTVPVCLDVRLDRRLPELIEIAAYYAVAEALPSTAKHARATGDDVLWIQVRDDGRGGAHLGGGKGVGRAHGPD
jgi:signal transduction histidine kinase